jgi:hypothetical protein
LKVRMFDQFLHQEILQLCGTNYMPSHGPY